MKRILAALLLVAALLGGDNEAFAAKGKEKLKTFDAGSDLFTMYVDIRYGNRPEGVAKSDTASDRLLDLYIPTTKAPKGGYPVFFFVHGGGFAGGNKSNAKLGYDRVCKSMAERGYAVVSINYYLTMKYKKVKGVSCGSEMKHGLPKTGLFHPLVHQAVRNASSDATLALEWVKKNAKRFHLNTDLLTVCGGSAGSMTVLHLAYFSGQQVLPIHSVVNLWGGVDAPAKIAAPAPPMLIYHGDQDELIHVDYAYAFEKRLQEIGVPVEMHILVGKGHAQYVHIATKRCDEIDAFIKRMTNQN
ncbi:MAG: alpha/beta hydrolase [Alistipes sp.]|nr:alpha/beta hydrolase [Alistipes sp.]